MPSPSPSSLASCPFCGGVNIIRMTYNCYCHSCGAEGPDADTTEEHDVDEAWNRRAAPAVQALGQAEPVASHQQLMKFYGVDSLAALVEAQARHVEKLQAKLPPTPSLAPQRVREG